MSSSIIIIIIIIIIITIIIAIIITIVIPHHRSITIVMSIIYMTYIMGQEDHQLYRRPALYISGIWK